MLNRRTLRIKVMQNMYAYRLCKKANKALSQGIITEKYSPDLNSMEVQDPVALKESQIIALNSYDALFNNQPTPSIEDEMSNLIKDSIKGYHEANKNDFRRIKMQMIDDVEKILDKYHMILSLVLEWAFRSKMDSEKKVDVSDGYSLNFYNNRVIVLLGKLNLSKHSSWEGQPTLVKTYYKDLVRNNERFNEYQKLSETTFEQDQKIVEYVIKSIIFKSNSLQSYFEELDLNWEENREIVKSLARKTIKNATEKEINLLNLSYSWDEDKEFFIDLYQKTGDHDEEFEKLISERSLNWDIERVASTDKIILKLALSEMINFPSIPVKVSINEYIEIAKQYSTPKSRNFINGILDVLAEDLKKEGKIRKSGRGLIDNK